MDGLLAIPRRSLLTAMAVVSVSLVGSATLALAPPGGQVALEVTEIPGNPTCADLGYASGVKDDDPYDDKTIDGIVFDYSDAAHVTVSGDGVVAVIVKGGNAANVYVPPEPDMVAPVNASGGVADISHVDACLASEPPPTSVTEPPPGPSVLPAEEAAATTTQPAETLTPPAAPVGVQPDYTG
jgi:hypothetical protein